MKPLELIFEAKGAAGRDPLPDPLTRLYGGMLKVARGTLYANFVATLDGVVAVPGPGSGSLVSGHSEADRFVMGLLRARADAVLIGSGTFRADPGHKWTAGHVFPAAQAAYAEYRKRLKLAAEPVLVIASTSGHLDASHPALQGECIVLTTGAEAPQLRSKLPRSVTVRSLGTAVEAPRIVEALRSEGLDTVLSEAGPHLMGSLLKTKLVDHLFLTVSPQLAGRSEQMLHIVEGIDFLRHDQRWGTLVSVRRHESHLFTRYSLVNKTVKPA